MLALRDKYYGGTADGVYATGLDTNISVRRMDWPRMTEEDQTALARENGER